MDSGPAAPRRPGMTTEFEAHFHIPAALMRPSDAYSFYRSLETGGRRECRVHAAPTALRANEKDARRPTQVRRNHSGTPCAMALRLLRALPGVPGLLASVTNESRRFGRKAEIESPF